MAEEVSITRQGFHEHYKSIDDAIIKGGENFRILQFWWAIQELARAKARAIRGVSVRKI